MLLLLLLYLVRCSTFSHNNPHLPPLKFPHSLSLIPIRRSPKSICYDKILIKCWELPEKRAWKHVCSLFNEQEMLSRARIVYFIYLLFNHCFSSKIQWTITLTTHYNNSTNSDKTRSIVEIEVCSTNFPNNKTHKHYSIFCVLFSLYLMYTYSIHISME